MATGLSVGQRRKGVEQIHVERFHAGEPGHLVAWLDQEIAQVEDRLAFFKDLLDGLD